MLSMSNAQFMARAADVLREIAGHVKPDQLDLPTPCTEFDVRKLVNHLLFWGPSLVGAGRKETVPPPAESEADVDLTTAGDWQAALLAHLANVVDAWSRPDAWEGVAHLGGPMELPADLIGGMVVGELVVHGWDLARATGQQPVWDDELAEYLHGEVAKSAEVGRQMGVYAEPVAVPESASPLDRMLALSGRDPGWTA
ncbi:TIGR03086 family metal-binding protein [Flindersiella endophytica]